MQQAGPTPGEGLDGLRQCGSSPWPGVDGRGGDGTLACWFCKDRPPGSRGALCPPGSARVLCSFVLDVGFFDVGHPIVVVMRPIFIVQCAAPSVVAVHWHVVVAAIPVEIISVEIIVRRSAPVSCVAPKAPRHRRPDRGSARYCLASSARLRPARGEVAALRLASRLWGASSSSAGLRRSLRRRRGHRHAWHYSPRASSRPL